MRTITLYDFYYIIKNKGCGLNITLNGESFNYVTLTHKLEVIIDQQNEGIKNTKTRATFKKGFQDGKFQFTCSISNKRLLK